MDTFFQQYLNDEDANILRKSLRLNYVGGSDMRKARQKIIRDHIWGRPLLLQNDCEDFIDIHLMPRVLALICRANTSLLDDNDDSPSYSKLNTIRFDAIYRILQARPELCSESRSDTLKLSDSRKEIRELSSTIKSLVEENKRLRAMVCCFASFAAALVFVVTYYAALIQRPVRYS